MKKTITVEHEIEYNDDTLHCDSLDDHREVVSRCKYLYSWAGKKWAGMNGRDCYAFLDNNGRPSALREDGPGPLRCPSCLKATGDLKETKEEVKG